MNYFTNPNTYKVFNILLTTRCNLRCKNCSFGCQSKKSNSDVPLDTAIKTINKVESLLKGTSLKEYSSSFLGGETLLYPHLNGVIDYVNKNCKYVRNSYLTNGLLIPKLSNETMDLLSTEQKYNNAPNFYITKYPIKYNYNKLFDYIKACHLTYSFFVTDSVDSDGMLLFIIMNS